MSSTVDLLQIKIEKAKRELPLETVNAINSIDWRTVILQMREKKGYTFEQLGDLELETELLLCGLLAPKNYPGELEKRMHISRAVANELVNEMNDLVFIKIREELIKNTERKRIFSKSEKVPANFTPEEHKKELMEIHPSQFSATLEEKNKENNMDRQILKSAGIEIIEESTRHDLENVSEILPTPDLPAVLPAQLMQAEKLELKTTRPPVSESRVEIVNSLLAQKLSTSFKIPIVKTEHSLDNITKTNTPNPASVKPKVPSIDPYREIPE